MRLNGFTSAPAAEALRSERPSGPPDFKLLFIVVTLLMAGLVIVYASTYHLGPAYLRWQFVRAGVGLVALLVGVKLDHVRLGGKTARVALLLLALSALGATFVLGKFVGVTQRNIMGVVQPSEFAKFVLVLWLAGYFADLKETNRQWGLWNSLLKPAGIAAAVILLTVLQPAIGTSFIMFVSSCMVFFIAGVKKRFLLLGLVVLALLGFGALQVLKRVDNTKFDYVQRRIVDFDGGENYHQKQSLIAIGSGGLLGRGLGEGKQKYYFLPKLHKDFIFATVGEELGFVGCLAILLLYAGFLFRGMAIAQSTTNWFGQYLAAGIVVTVFTYSLVHEAVTLALIPTTGQPLPFISYGGSALVANMFAAGMLLRISRFRRYGLDESGNRRRGHRWPRVSGARAGN